MCKSCQRHQHHHEHKSKQIPDRHQLILDQNLLWSSHFYLTRQLLFAVVNNSCVTNFEDQLLANQDLIGANFGALVDRKSAAKALSTLLREHIRIAVEIVGAASKGESINKLYEEWKLNAAEIGRCYHKYHQQIKERKIIKMMETHLKTTLDEATAILGGDCAKSVVTGDIALAHVKMMAEYIGSTF